MTRIPNKRAVGLMAWGAVAALSVSTLSVAWAAPGSAGPTTVRVKMAEGLFQPAKAGPKAWVDADLQARTVRQGETWTLQLEPAGAVAQTVTLPAEMVQITGLHRRGDRLVVTGWMNSALATAVVVVDWRQGTVVDEFWGYEVAVSPDAEWIAFIRFHPSHFVQGAESQYRLYRTSASPAANHPDGLAQAPASVASRDVGQAVYPLAESERGRSNVNQPASTAHHHQSRLIWAADSRQWGFVDLQDRKARLIVVRRDQGAEGQRWSTRVHDLPEAASLCLPGLGTPTCAPVPTEAVQIQFVEDGVRLQGGHTVARHLPWTGFKAL